MVNSVEDQYDVCRSVQTSEGNKKKKKKEVGGNKRESLEIGVRRVFPKAPTQAQLAVALMLAVTRRGVVRDKTRSK